MGLKDRKKNKLKQQNKRKKMRKKLAAKGENPEDYFINGIFVGTKKAE
ncbi:MAG: hypothetical protein GF408_06805 [Candidatus Omnitrophica bacterium]|nr:hypothetical protein [Candidatus Omnitrophota bacterium]